MPTKESLIKDIVRYRKALLILMPNEAVSLKEKTLSELYDLRDKWKHIFTLEGLKEQ